MDTTHWKRAALRLAVTGLVAGFGLVDVPETAEAGLHEFVVSVAGEYGGRVRIDGDWYSPDLDDTGPFALPGGACGFLWHEPAGYYWAANSDGTDPMSFPYPDADTLDALWYTGYYHDCPDAPYAFTAPFTENYGAPPDGAAAFVVQVYSLNDVEGLDGAGNEIEVPEFPDDPEEPNICELFPDLCEPEANFTTCSLFSCADGRPTPTQLDLASTSPAPPTGRVLIAPASRAPVLGRR